MINELDRKRKKILTLCIAISLAVHALCLTFIHEHSLWFYSPVESSKCARMIEPIPRDQILKEAFSSTTSSPVNQTQKEPTFREFSHFLQTLQEPPSPSTAISVPPIDQLLSNAAALFPVHTFTMPTMKSFDFFADIQKNLMIPMVQSTPLEPLHHPLSQRLAATSLETQNVSSPDSPESAVVFNSSADSLLPPQEDAAFSKNPPTVPLPRLPELPSLQDLSTLNLSEAFEAELTFVPKPEGSGYLFALTLLPRADLNLPKIRQKITFLIDRSNSIQQERFLASKQAVLRALEEFDKDDQFNIIIFDGKIEKLFPALSHVSPNAISRAEAFLDKVHLGSFFTISDLYKPLLLTSPSSVREDEIYSAILLTDGDAFSKKQNQQTFIKEWTQHNQGKVSLYAVSMEHDSHLEILETICTANRGALYQSSTERGLKRQLLKLAKAIKTPLAKNISLKAISRSSQDRINIHPKPSIAPHLYLNQPYVILGSAETLDDFVIFVQGKLENKWVNIKKQISFVHAKRGGNALKIAHNRLEKMFPEEAFAPKSVQ